MPVRFGKFLTVLTLAATLGLHWALLQSVAWTTMLADNLCSHSLSVSVERTFDGKHPCPLCKAIAAGKKSETRSVYTIQFKKLEFPPATPNFAVFAPGQFWLLPLANDTFAELFTSKPLTPPPRDFFI
ncbi:MAG TPA: hypothetical protein VFY06_09165 [Verrucomicrobiae bacterium]|nr:hypothetical protein [Verrucomicrobiae bacterium]